MAKNYLQLCELMQNTILSGDTKKHSPQEWIVGRPGFPAEDQLYAYTNGYRIRLLEAVSEDYPALRHLLQERLMDKFVKRYVETTPPKTYSLVPYCQQLPIFIAKDKKLEKQTSIDRCLIHELAILECSITIVFHLPETPALTPADVAESDSSRFGEAILKLREASELHHFFYPVNSYLSAVYNEEDPQIPTLQDNYVAVFRHDYQVWRLGLEYEEYLLLQKLAQGLCVAEAIAAVVEESDLDPENLLEPIARWFRRWVNDGLLQKTDSFTAK